MKKLLALLTAFIFVLAACGSNESKEKDSKTLTVGTEGTYAPFTFHDKDGKLTGYDVEVTEAVAKKAGYKVKFVETQWDSMFSGLNAGRFDTVANQVGINAERKEKYNFSNPYTYSEGVLVVRKNNDTIKSFDDVKGKKLAQTLTSNYGKLAKDKGAEITSVEGFNQAMEMVLSNRVEGTFNDKLSVLDYQKQKKSADIKLITGNAEKSQSGFVFTKKTDKKVIEDINKAIDALQKDGTLTKISKKWFGEDVSKA
ncbi:amino acid ABC transporter substrate-binding protein [Macrococcus armenti]|uniref:amino acid ABC transporter substrate-binding protein n=1 Tax=Macrococcus armenti TaxID=2875764 RepID=UPI001CC9A937|nr:amino acid ABC transporter substrate-binding protein [Macrococcus armenti]UBH12560.1 amino acid ABC transporter substrate-binding protein [Macrococcus armenti]UBH21715.1 amino acid ABC transporter substrate-binding protein [Macrococcus armenti]